MDGYRETGSEPSEVCVNQAGMDDGHACLGSRWMGLVGSNLFGRKRWRNCVSTRPRTWETTVEKRRWASGQPQLRAASAWSESERTALQIGAGLSVRARDAGDNLCERLSADIRDPASSLNGSIGYRYDF